MEREEEMLNQRKQILQIAVVSIMCLVLAGGAQGVPPHYTTFDGSGFVFEFEDAFPVPDRLHIAQVQSLPSYAGTFDTEIVALSLKSSSPYPLPLMSLPGGTYAVDSFFDVFTELTMSSGPDTIVARLSDPDGIIQMVIPPEPMNPPGALRSIQIEIVSMELTGDVGGIPITIRVSPSPSLQSTGETTIRELGDGTFQIDSFFDVFTELSVQGGPFVPQSNLEPMRLELTPVRLGQFEVAVAGNGDSWNEEPDESGNNDGWVNPDTQRRWINYPQDPDDALVDPRGNVEQGPFGVSWWNEWWWNDKYDRERVKMINLSFDYKLIDPTIPGFINVAINWSTTDWSLNPPPGIDPTGPLGQPPLSDFDPSTPGVPWVGRWKLKEEEDIPAEIANPLLTFETGNILLPVPYNPEWVSIDVRGYNFTIEGGQFSHECIPDPDLPPTFEQLDWVGLTTSTPDSTWGRVTLPYNLPPAIYYFNLSIGGAAAPTRVVHNLSFESPGGDQKLMAYFNLGVTDGTDVSSLDYGYSISNVPVAADPPVTSTASVPDLEFQIGSEGGIDLGSPSPPQKNTSNSAVNVADPSNSGVLADKDKFVNQPQGKNQCAPGAISNSLKYLQATGKIPAAIPTGIGAVGTVVGTTATGTPQSWYLKKKTHYKKHINTRWIDAPLTVAKVQELVRELKDGQDIEMDLDGHVEVLAGIRLKADGTVDLDLYDDNQKDKKSDPMHTSPLMTDGTDDYVDGMKLQRFVIECPKEPATATTCSPHLSLNTADE
ncbi:hypothetical protein KAR91_29650, partial [Candidatus Pacearchaeota archaeon]|nr:hypothetical protein [Candidatus Pacearchaeota archaeon]